MANGQYGLFFLRKKIKRLLKKRKTYWRKFVNRGIYVVSVVIPLTTIPQIYKIWSSQDASGISLITWLAYLVSASFWLAYGISKKAPVLIINSTLWVFFEILVVVGTVLYG